MQRKSLRRIIITKNKSKGRAHAFWVLPFCFCEILSSKIFEKVPPNSFLKRPFMVYLLGSLLALFADRKINGSESLTGERGNIHGGKIDRFTFIAILFVPRYFCRRIVQF